MFAAGGKGMAYGGTLVAFHDQSGRRQFAQVFGSRAEVERKNFSDIGDR